MVLVIQDFEFIISIRYLTMHFSVLSISRNRWSTYVKRCHEMIAFLTASTLAFQHVRYLIDAQRKCGSLIHLEDYISHCKVPWRQHYHG